VKMVHPTAVVASGAEIAPDVEIGPYTVVGKDVKIGSGTKIGSHAVLEGVSELGENNRIFSSAVIGSCPQDLKYKGEKTRVKIGNGNTIREFVTINTGTAGGGGETVIGDENLIMAYCHIAHDCVVANRVVMANAATLGGHVVLEDRVIVSGLTALHHFVRIGSLAMLAGCSKVVIDVPPFALFGGNPAKVYGLNVVGLKRSNVPVSSRNALKKAFKLLYSSGLNSSQAFEKIREDIPETEEVSRLLSFIQEASKGKSGRALQKAF
jgi:UDP-N-acetylglucosamine acyltransferase